MKKNILFLFGIATQLVAFSQGLTFYHMRNVIPQGNHFSATAFPNANSYVSIPALNFNVSASNSFNFNDVGTIGDTSLILDLDKFLDETKEDDFFQTGVIINGLNIGFKSGEKSHMQIFSNLKFRGSFGYPKRLMSWVVKGNRDAAHVGQDYKIDDFGLNTVTFGEFGIGYMRDVKIAGLDFRFGTRIKYLMGLSYIGSDENPEIYINTDANTSNMKIWSNATKFNMVGRQLMEDGEDQIEALDLISGKNSGFGLDLSAEWNVNEKLNISWAVNDIGSINWKENVEVISYRLDTIFIDGAGFERPDNTPDNVEYSFSTALGDTLEARFDDPISGDTLSGSSFRTGIGARSFLSATYEVIPNGKLSVSISNYSVLGDLRTAYGVGYTHELGNVLALSATVSKLPKRSPSLGAGFKLQLGAFQIYAAGEGLLGLIDLKTLQRLDVWAGINLQFGNPRKKKEQEGISVD